MAIGLDQLQRRRGSPTRNVSPSPPAAGRRPWQSHLRPDLDFCESPDLTGESEAELVSVGFPVPEAMENASHAELAQILVCQFFESRWRKWRRKSYWLSRLTHRRSWLARLELSPQVRIPLPSWLTQHSTNQD